MSVRALTLGVVALFALPALASAESDVVRTDTQRVTLFTGGDFGGTSHLEGTAAGYTLSGSSDLGAAPLVGLRYEAPLHTFFLLGAQFRAEFWRWEDGGSFASGDAGNPILDFSLTPKARYAFRTGKVALEPYVVMPVGFSLGVWKDDSSAANAGADRTNPGWNLGALFGLTVLSPSGFGGMLELGVMHHAIYDQNDKAATYTLTLTQFTLHVGATYAF